MRAHADDVIDSVAGSGNLAGFLGVNAAASGYYLAAITRAHIDGNVTAPDVLVHAEAESFVEQLAVSVLGAGAIAGGAAATGVLSAKTTEAFVATTGVVHATGTGAGIATVGAGADGTPVALNIGGLVVRALNHDDYNAIAIGGGAAPLANVAASAVTHVTDNTTRAVIDGTVTADRAVDLLAWDRTTGQGIAGGVSIAALVGVGASATGGQIAKLTEAVIGPTATVDAGEVAVRAVTHEDLLAIAGTVGLSGAIGIAGAAGATASRSSPARGSPARTSPPTATWSSPPTPRPWPRSSRARWPAASASPSAPPPAACCWRRPPRPTSTATRPSTPSPAARRPRPRPACSGSPTSRTRARCARTSTSSRRPRTTSRPAP